MKINTWLVVSIWCSFTACQKQAPIFLETQPQFFGGRAEMQWESTYVDEDSQLWAWAISSMPAGRYLVQKKETDIKGQAQFWPTTTPPTAISNSPSEYVQVLCPMGGRPSLERFSTTHQQLASVALPLDSAYSYNLHQLLFWPHTQQWVLLGETSAIETQKNQATPTHLDERDILLLVLDTALQIRFQQRIGLSQKDQVLGAKIHPDGRLFIVGSSEVNATASYWLQTRSPITFMPSRHWDFDTAITSWDISKNGDIYLIQQQQTLWKSAKGNTDFQKIHWEPGPERIHGISAKTQNLVVLGEEKGEYILAQQTEYTTAPQKIITWNAPLHTKPLFEQTKTNIYMLNQAQYIGQHPLSLWQFDVL